MTKHIRVMSAEAATASEGTARDEGFSIVQSLDSSGLREIGSEATWLLSSAKPGNGVDQLRDDATATYWQSDGHTPHTIDVSFTRRVAISCVCLYLDHGMDESYTPDTIQFLVGCTEHDLQVVARVELLSEPTGWVVVPLRPPAGMEMRDHLVRGFLLQIQIIHMHQSGRDTHVRQVKVFSPQPKTGPTAGRWLDLVLR